PVGADRTCPRRHRCRRPGRVEYSGALGPLALLNELSPPVSRARQERGWAEIAQVQGFCRTRKISPTWSKKSSRERNIGEQIPTPVRRKVAMEARNLQPVALA